MALSNHHTARHSAQLNYPWRANQMPGYTQQYNEMKRSKSKVKPSINNQNNKEKTDQELAERLNPTGGFSWNVHTKNGAVRFGAAGMPGCCGIGIVYSFSFGNMKDKEKLYEEIKEYIMNDATDALNRKNIVFTDAVGGESKQVERGMPCVYEMCQFLGLKESGKMFNPRTGHYLIMFTLEKKVVGSRNSFTVDENTGEVVHA